MIRDNRIDGWRGLSVALVIFGHLILYRYSEFFPVLAFRDLSAAEPEAIWTLVWNIVARPLATLPSLGVSVFFVISGYLITSLMQAETEKQGSVNLVAFWVRRCFRILPALAAYIVSLMVLASMGYISLSFENIFVASTFRCNFPLSQCGWWLGHTWSLAVEEQFYLVWPILFVLTPRRWKLPLLIVLAMLFIGLSIWTVEASPFAHIAIGSIFGLWPALREQFASHVRAWHVYASIAVLLLVPFAVSLPFGQFLSAFNCLLVTIVFFGTVQGHGPLVGTVSDTWMQKLGLISYSVYLWQQLFTGNASLYTSMPWLSFPLLLFIPAIMSYHFIEKPAVDLARQLSRRLSEAAVARTA
jgi:peptidoglycan/LPS O-acetylase OafA/YrhL